MIKTCKKCKGTGEIQGPFSDYEVWKCEQCNGTGKELKVRRAIRLEGLSIDLEISKATAIKTDKKMIHLDELPDGTWRIIYNGIMIPDLTKLEAMRFIREEG